MEYAVRTTGTPDLATIERALCALDAAVVVDLDPAGRAIRVSTWATSRELVEALHGAGMPVAVDDVEQLPSVCCGGCSFG